MAKAEQSLAVKYRPQKFDDLTEQESIKTILRHQLDTKTIKNCYLFVGPAGCGKTTSARIFADEINDYHGNPIELDAASNNSVDDMRNIIKQAQTQSLDSEYKIFIIDECFHGDTLISTVDGSVPIRDIKEGTIVRNMYGVDTVTHVFKNRVFTDRLCCVIINGVKTYTTIDHLYFTQDGWVEAQNLQKGDIVYAPTYMRGLWERIFEQTEDSEVLLQYLCTQYSRRGEATEVDAESSYKILCDLWEAILSKPIGQEKDMFLRVQEQIYKYSRTIHDAKYKTWGDFANSIIKEDVGEQSYEKSRYITENDRYTQIKWYMECLERTEGWKRSIHDTAINFMGEFGQSSNIRILHTDKNEEEFGVSYMLQIRPWLSRKESSDRGGWERSQIEEVFGKGREENTISNVFRVDSVEVYQRGYNDELFRCGFADSELSQECVDMYDLEVGGHHSYFANGVLVHNCHMITIQGWNALLKLLEEPPAKSIFMFCTTDPQKLPKTILSRVQRYDFQRISNKGIVDRLAYILGQENLRARGSQEEALQYLAKLSEGGMRDAITLMDKCLSYSSELTVDNVVKALGVTNYGFLFSLNDAIFSKNVHEVLKVVGEIHASGQDLKKFISTYVGFLLDICKYRILKSFDYLILPSTYSSFLDEYSDAEFDMCRDLLDYMLKLNNSLKYESKPKAVIEAMLLLYMSEDER